MGWMVLDSIPGTGKFVCSPKRPDWRCSPPVCFSCFTATTHWMGGGGKAARTSHLVFRLWLSQAIPPYPHTPTACTACTGQLHLYILQEMYDFSCVPSLTHLTEDANGRNYFVNIHSFIHSVFCLTTGPKPPPKQFLHTVQFQMRASSPVLKVIQYLLMSSSSSSCHFHLSLYLSFDNLF